MRLVAMLLAAVATGTVFFAPGGQPYIHAADFAKLAPYPAIRWQGSDAPEVRIDGEWVTLRSIDGHRVSDIASFAQGAYGGKWQKRFDEDLVQVLTEMGHPPGTSVTLVVENPETGDERTLADVPMTAENRKAILSFKRSDRPLTAEDMSRAIDDFERALEERWSYRHARKVDYDGEIGNLRARIQAGISASEFAIELQKIIAHGIDGHAGIDGFKLPPGGCLPFLIEPIGKRYVAFKPDRSAFLDEQFPYIATIDGKSLSVLCDVASILVPKGSSQYQQRQALRVLREFDYFRGLLELPKTPTISVKLLAPDFKTTKTVELPVFDRPPRYGVWPRGESRVCEGNVGYLRLPTMEADASTREIREWMPKFKETAGLIVDVRDNGGGDRDALRLLYSYLVAPGAAPRVFTVAMYRLHAEHAEDHLSARFMVRADSPGLSDATRQAIDEFEKKFKPRWGGDLGKLRDATRTDFSPRHYMVLERLDEPTIEHYAKPVIVLMNANCFSASDIFLAGLQGLPNVTLMGTASGGGSARVQVVRLGETPFSLRIGSMVSFQANGRLFDGFGVAPDVEVLPEPAYFVGGTDNLLEAALQRIRDTKP